MIKETLTVIMVPLAFVFYGCVIQIFKQISKDTDEHIRIANALKEASANIHEIQNKGCETDLEINEQLANELIELERILGWDTTRPEGFTFERLAHLIDPTCTIIYYETTPRGADECDKDWYGRDCQLSTLRKRNNLWLLLHKP